MSRLDDNDDDDKEDEDIDAEHRCNKHSPIAYVKLMFLSVGLLMAVGFLGVRLHNSCIAPFVDALKEQSLILRNNTINYNKKCLDLAVKASYDGFDNCIAHETIIKAGYYYPALQIYLRKMDPCSDKGCLHVEMNAMSWLMFIVPVGFGLSTLLLAVVIGIIVIGLHRALNTRYELPNRMPFQTFITPKRQPSRNASKRVHTVESFTYPPPQAPPITQRTKMNDVI